MADPAFNTNQGVITPTSAAVYDPSSGKTTAPGQPVNTASPISIAGLNTNQTPIDPSQAIGPAIPDVSNISAALAKTYDATAQDQKYTQTSNQLQDINNQLAGKADFEAQQYRNAGFGATTDANGNVTGIDPQNADLQGQLDAIAEQGKAIPLQMQTDFTGRASVSQMQHLSDAALRTNAVQALQVAAQISIRNGKLATAKQYIDQAVQQKYGKLEAQQASLMKNLQLIKNDPNTTLQDKKQADERTVLLQQQATQTELAKQNYLGAQTEVLKYAGVADADTLKEMGQANSPAEVAQIAASKGIQQPQSGRYKDIVTTTHNLDGTTTPKTAILDTLTGKLINVPGQSAATLNAGSSGTSSGASADSTPGTTGSSTIDATTPGYSTTMVAGRLTQAAVDQQALSYLTTGKTPPIGRTGLAGIQNAAIQNRMAEMNPGGNLASHGADLKAYSASLATQQKYLDTTTRAFNTANDTLASLQSYMTMNNINPSQFPSFNSFSNYLKSKGLDPGAAGGYNAQITTLRQEYSQVLAKGGVRSVETDKEAAQLIPSGLAPAQLAKVAAQIKIDGENVTNDAQKQVSDIQNKINGIIQPQAQNDQYASYRSQVPTGQILINRSGQIGHIPPNEYNAKTDTKL